MGFTFIILLLTTATAVASPIINNPIQLLKLHPNVDCLSWRLAVETNNLQKWTQVPEECEDYVRHYMLGKQYRKDVEFVAAEAYKYAKSLNLTGDGKDVWVFDIDETTLSNIPYFTRENAGFGAINITAFYEWMEEVASPAIPASLALYKKLIKLGFKIVFLTGADTAYSEPRTKNMKAVGYTKWLKIIFYEEGDGSGLEYKSSKRKELEDAGYRIRGNMGDQWVDLLGSNPGDRTFKVPNPMYYAA